MTNETTATDFEVIHTYTADQALEDGVLFDARQLPDDAGKITDELFGDIPKVVLSAALYETMRKAVAAKRHCNDWRGVWWDIVQLAGVFGATKRAMQGANEDGVGYGTFPVIITGAARRRNYRLMVAATCDGTITFMHPEDR